VFVPFRLTLKNYRSYEDRRPVTIEFRSPVVAFVGANNSGKSSVMRFLFEFAYVWHAFSQPVPLGEALREGVREEALQSLEEAPRILARMNDRPMTAQVDLLDSPGGVHPPPVTRLILTIERRQESLDRLKIGVAIGPLPDLPETHVITVDEEGLARSMPQPAGGAAAVPAAQETALFDLRPMLGLMKFLSGAKYLTANRTVSPHARGYDYDALLGHDLATRWATWKAGTVSQRQTIQALTQQIRNLIGVREFEINASNGQFNVVVEQIPLDLTEMGAGISLLTATLMNVALSRPSILLIDEPELGLHPALQVLFVNLLASYTSMVMFSTHSIGLARATVDGAIYSFRLKDGRTEVAPLAATQNYSQFLAELGTADYSRLGFDRLLLVEGVNEVRSAGALLRALGVQKRILILPLGGSALINGNRQEELDEFSRIADRGDIFVLIDSEVEAEGAPLSPDRQHFLAVCEDLGYSAMATKRRAVENYFTERAVKAAFGQNASAIGPYDNPKTVSGHGWTKNTAYKIAEEIQPGEIEATDLGEFLLALG